jgi:hypothetical protein
MFIIINTYATSKYCTYCLTHMPHHNIVHIVHMQQYGVVLTSTTMYPKLFQCMSPEVHEMKSTHLYFLV